MTQFNQLNIRMVNLICSYVQVPLVYLFTYIYIYIYYIYMYIYIYIF